MSSDIVKVVNDKRHLSWKDLEIQANEVAQVLARHFKMKKENPNGTPWRLWGVPRGGVHAAMLVRRVLEHRKYSVELVSDPYETDVLVDDIVSTGGTREKFSDLINDGRIFVTLIDKKESKISEWLVFPWEAYDDAERLGPADNIVRILEKIGEDPEREGLVDTPMRVIKSWDEIYSGYKQNVEEVLTIFNDPCNEMVVLKDIEFYSTCEHHMLPFHGKAHIGYIPRGQVIGISKLARILEIYSRRLQIQERICKQVTAALMEHLTPDGAACVLSARHMCISCRGVNKQSSEMVTSSLEGTMREGPVRSEFLRLCGL